MTTETARRPRGRPRTSGELQCDRCGRATGKIRVHWPDGRICGICYHQAARTFGVCDQCGQQRLLPGRSGDHQLCIPCSGITTALGCTRCGAEGERYRRGICARCALRDDLTAQLTPQGTQALPGLHRLIDALCAVDRPESVITWKRHPDVIRLLADIGTGKISLDHAGIDAAPAGRAREHLRQMLVHTGLLPARDVDLSYFETWLQNRLNSISDPAVRRPLERFATWHHLERIRRRAHHGDDVHGATHTAKQEITEVGRFLTWLADRHQTIADCTQADLEEWLTNGPSTRTTIRTFIVWASNNRTSRKLAGDDAGAHRVNQVEHLRFGAIPALGDAVLGQRLRRAAAALIKGCEETPAGANLLKLCHVHDCHPGSSDREAHSALLRSQPVRKAMVLSHHAT